MNNDDTIGCLALVITIVVVLAGAGIWDYISCKNKSEKQGMECSWGPFQGCMVKTEKGWIDYERLRYMGEYDGK